MTDQGSFSVGQAAALMVVTLIAFGLRPCNCMCETRCEQSIPSLNRLRALWIRSFKRMGDQRLSFEQFLLSLIQASDSTPALRRLRTSILRIIGRYQDCVMACEHQFSKRSTSSSSKGYILDSLCRRLLLYQVEVTSQQLPHSISQYCSSRVVERLVK